MIKVDVKMQMMKSENWKGKRANGKVRVLKTFIWKSGESNTLATVDETSNKNILNNLNFLFYSLLVCYGCPRKIQQTVQLSNTFIFLYFWRLEVWDQGGLQMAAFSCPHMIILCAHIPGVFLCPNFLFLQTYQSEWISAWPYGLILT